jgi:hypothetical protein
MGYRLNEGITELSEWNVFLFAIGNLIFSYAVDKSDGTKAFGDFQYLLWIALIISVVNIFLPMEEINRALFKVDNGAVELPLDQVIHKFKTVSSGFFLISRNTKSKTQSQESLSLRK